MKTASAKAKGRRLQQLTVRKILEAFPHLTENDVRSTSMGVTGTDVQLSEAARKVFPYALEIRNREKFNVWQAVEDSEKHAQKETLTALVIFARNKTAPRVVLDLDEFMKLVKEASHEKRDCSRDQEVDNG